MEKPQARTLAPGTRVGPCTIIELIGHGGMGTVYRATHTALGRQVALKILAEPWASRTEFAQRFLSEARLAARLEDPHIVHIYDVGSDQGRYFIVMQLARGESLRDILRRGALDVRRALEVGEMAARGLMAAHQAGIVHRDIKPHNMVLSDEDAGLKILDFGLARFEQELASREDTTEIVGSAAYMAPEQSDFSPVDVRADLYSLGVTLYQALTGVLPFSSTAEGGVFELIARHQFELPRAPSLINRAVPLTVSRVVLRLLEKSPPRRYANAEALLEEFRLLRRHSLPIAPLPWGGRPLNPRTLVGGEKLAAEMRRVLRRRREQTMGGCSLAPLYALEGEVPLEWQMPEEALAPSHVISLVPTDGRATIEVADLAHARGEFARTDRLYLEWPAHSQQARLRISGAQPLDAIAAQHMFDLLEALEPWPKSLTVAVAPDYVMQAQDLRWLVDVYNLASKAGTSLAMVVGSARNHATLLRLGLDRHIHLRLELERAGADLADTAEPERADTPGKVLEHAMGGVLPGLRDAGTAQRERAAAVARTLAAKDPEAALVLWRELVREESEEFLTGCRPLRRELYDALSVRAQKAFDDGELELAAERYDALVDLDPGRYEGHLGKGLVFKKRGRLDYAVAFLTQAVLAAPDAAEVFYHRAIVRSRQGDQQGALRDLGMALEHNPRDARSYFNRSLLYKQMGRADLARKDMLIARRLNPEIERHERGKSTAKNLELKG